MGLGGVAGTAGPTSRGPTMGGGLARGVIRAPPWWPTSRGKREDGTVVGRCAGATGYMREPRVLARNGGPSWVVIPEKKSSDQGTVQILVAWARGQTQ
ncbi:hypothetical protein BU14_0027s0027 [Porphyra umbilicalis]|uniref:Uncharacterized protein n=1 Tax=Porphyra umbilicalis TaxID=2786 RepID=A0A1X6PJI9_PORUM|nr:hypothetical protein BU14_0027s0027 [Porphyra umbilicalis]|eukprot:OSX81001.1 hypothetical protein BU14_0027s0027 [Porphyra umbilicalis]